MTIIIIIIIINIWGHLNTHVNYSLRPVSSLSDSAERRTNPKSEMTRCRPTKLTFNLLFFCRFLSNLWHLSWNFSSLSLDVVLSILPIQHGRFLLRRFFSASEHVNDSSKSHFFAEILVFSSFLYSTKIRRNDKIFFLYIILCWLTAGRQNDSQHWRPTMLADNVGRANIVGRQCWPVCRGLYCGFRDTRTVIDGSIKRKSLPLFARNVVLFFLEILSMTAVKKTVVIGSPYMSRA